MAGDLLKGEHQDLNLKASELIAAFKSNKNSFNCSKSGFAFCWQFQIREKMTVLSSRTNITSRGQIIHSGGQMCGASLLNFPFLSAWRERGHAMRCVMY